jgi:hypothetical protein
MSPEAIGVLMLATLVVTIFIARLVHALLVAVAFTSAWDPSSST